MDKITKDWPEEFLLPVSNEKIFGTYTIGGPIVTWVKHFRQSSGMKKNKKE
jgi:hypothetical protein